MEKQVYPNEKVDAVTIHTWRRIRHKKTPGENNAAVVSAPDKLIPKWC